MDNHEETLEKAINTIKIEVGDQEKKILHHQLGQFLEWLALLEEAETENIEAQQLFTGVEKIKREDQPQESNLVEIRKEAAAFENGFYLVPRIID